MKHARIAWSGAIQQAVESDGQLLITQGPHKGCRVAFDEVVLRLRLRLLRLVRAVGHVLRWASLRED